MAVSATHSVETLTMKRGGGKSTRVVGFEKDEPYARTLCQRDPAHKQIFDGMRRINMHRL
jgi:hypothetical protein